MSEPQQCYKAEEVVHQWIDDVGNKISADDVCVESKLAQGVGVDYFANRHMWANERVDEDFYSWFPIKFIKRPTDDGTMRTSVILINVNKKHPRHGRTRMVSDDWPQLITHTINNRAFLSFQHKCADCVSLTSTSAAPSTFTSTSPAPSTSTSTSTSRSRTLTSTTETLNPNKIDS